MGWGEVLVYGKTIRFWNGLNSPQLWTMASDVIRLSLVTATHPFLLLEGGRAGGTAQGPQA